MLSLELSHIPETIEPLDDKVQRIFVGADSLSQRSTVSSGKSVVSNWCKSRKLRSRLATGSRSRSGSQDSGCEVGQESSGVPSTIVKVGTLTESIRQFRLLGDILNRPGVGKQNSAGATVLKIDSIDPPQAPTLIHILPIGSVESSAPQRAIRPLDVNVIVRNNTPDSVSSQSLCSSPTGSLRGAAMSHDGSDYSGSTMVLASSSLESSLKRIPSSHPRSQDSAARESAETPVRLTQLRICEEFDTGLDTFLASRSEAETSTANDQPPCSVTNVRPTGVYPLPPVWTSNGLRPTPIHTEIETEFNKGCCGSNRVGSSTAIRWFIAVISFLGLSCVIVGIVLGALTVSGSTRLTLCLLMIGVGIVLIIVSVMAWRLTSIDSSMPPSCWTLLGLSSRRPPQRGPASCHSPTSYLRMPNPRRGRGPTMPPMSGIPPGPPPLGVIYPEFVFNPPPPSYQASMQEQSLHRFMESTGAVIGSPPPTYRSRPSFRVGLRECTSQAPSPIHNLELPHPNRDSGRRAPVESSATPEGVDAAIASSVEPVQCCDQQQLLAANHRVPEVLPPTTSGIANSGYSAAPPVSTRADSSTEQQTRPAVSIVDCSAAEPIGFRLRRNEHEQRPISATLSEEGNTPANDSELLLNVRNLSANQQSSGDPPRSQTHIRAGGDPARLPEPPPPYQTMPQPPLIRLPRLPPRVFCGPMGPPPPLSPPLRIPRPMFGPFCWIPEQGGHLQFRPPFPPNLGNERPELRNPRGSDNGLTATSYV